MSALLDNIVERTQLAGNNKLEILLFSLGYDPRRQQREIYGINVFKVCEVVRVPPLTAAPDMPRAVKGMASLRGQLVPVLDLAEYAGVATEDPRNIMIVTEYNGRTQGFLVENVETIQRLDWGRMRVPPAILTAEKGGLVTAVTELADKRLLMMVDVEKVLAEMRPPENDLIYRSIQKIERESLGTVFFADDSLVARKMVEKTLETMGVRHYASINGQETWDALEKTAARAAVSGRPTSDFVSLVITDIEMPEMDGYLLTKKIKSDPRFAGIPVIMHSSLSGESNQALGFSVGVNEYVPKMQPKQLSEAVAKYLGQQSNQAKT